MFYKLCAKCGAVIPLGETYCAECKPKKQTRDELNIDDSEEMDERAEAFYNSRQWRRFRQGILARDRYLCVNCAARGKLSVASDVHHIIRVKQDWNKRFDPSNCISLCKACHNKADRAGVSLPHGGAKKFDAFAVTRRPPSSSQQKRRK